VNYVRVDHDDREPLSGLRDRLGQCRRLALAVTDQRTTDALSSMIVELEANIRRREAKLS
jgi:hypothetical protein